MSELPKGAGASGKAGRSMLFDGKEKPIERHAWGCAQAGEDSLYDQWQVGRRPVNIRGLCVGNHPFLCLMGGYGEGARDREWFIWRTKHSGIKISGGVSNENEQARTDYSH